MDLWSADYVWDRLPHESAGGLRKKQNMKRLLRSTCNWLRLFGINPGKTIRAIKGLPQYCRDFRTLQRQRQFAAKKFPLAKFYPYLEDRAEGGGCAAGHYFHQDLRIARRIFQNNPKTHVDVGSRVDGFVAHVASFRPIEVFDVRPVDVKVANISFHQADLMALLPPELEGYCDSLSCLHALEHFGLGRYGDPVNYDGYLMGLNNLSRMLKGGGKLYLSVPIGPQRIEFNAHRVFSLGYLLECLSGGFMVDSFSYVDDGGDLHEEMPLTAEGVASNYGCTFGLGILELTRRSVS